MKIKKLHIYNIASIEDETIDFTAPPLSDSDVFLITGKTGSGKTTILDAICLALYRTTPRLWQCTGVKVENNSDNLALDDPRQLMRRNTGEAFVTLAFEGIDGHEYEAEWHVQRGRKKKPNVSLDPATWALRDFTSGHTYTGRGEKVNEVRQAVLQAVGLDFGQFCRTTMLAQGEFTRFLKSNEKEKVEILEKITRFTEYTLIGRRIYEITSAKKKAWDEAVMKAQDTGLDEDTLAALQEEIKDAECLMKQQARERERLARMQQWLVSDALLKKEQREAEDALQRAEASIQTEEFRQTEQTVGRWRETADARNALREKKEADAAVRHYQQQRAGYAMAYQNLLDGIAFCEKLHSEKNDACRQVGLYLAQNAPKEALYDQAGRIALQLNQVAADRSRISSEQNRIAAGRRKLSEDVMPRYVEAEKALAGITETMIQCENDIKAREQQLEAMDMNLLYKQYQQLAVMVGLSDHAEKLLNNLQAVRKAYDERGRKLAQTLEELEAKAGRVSLLAPSLAAAKARMEASEALLRKHNNTVEKWAVHMRQSLQVGDVCPVCRQPITGTLPAETVIQEMYLQAKEQHEADRRAHDDLERSMNRLTAEINAERNAYQRDKQAYDSDRSVVEAERGVADVCRQCGIAAISDDIRGQLQSLRQSFLQQGEALKTRIAEGEKKEKEIRTLRSSLATMKQKRDTLLQPAFDKCREEKEKCEKGIETSDILVATTQEALARTIRAISACVPEEEWTTNPKGYAAALSAAARTYHDRQQERHTLEKELEQLSALVQGARDIQRIILSALPEWQRMEATGCRRNNALIAELNKLAGEVTSNIALSRKASDTLANVQQQLEAFLARNPAMTLDVLEGLYALSSARIEEMEAACQRARAELQKQQALLANVNTRIQHHLLDDTCRMLAEQDSVDSLNEALRRLDAESSSLNQAYGVKKKILQDDRERKARVALLKEQADRARDEYDRWQRVNFYLGDANGTRFQKIAQSYILGSLLNSANVYLRRLAPRYTLIAVPGTLYISLEDAYQGFATRGTDSLSGGESFLVSLALALALADIGDTLSVDTLFIDEGFGTLSGQALMGAINTLRTLHSQSGRHVGVISHVEEVKAGIPVQIQVVQEGNSSSSRIMVV